MNTRKQLLALFIFIGFSLNANAQADSISRWEASVSSGLFLDLFYLDFSIIGDPAGGGGPLYYSNIKGKKIKPGKIDRIELKYNLNRKEALSLNFAYAQWKSIYGTGSDPLELWTETRRVFHRIQFVANYYRNFYSKNKRSVFHAGIGFMIQGEQMSYPFYRVVDDGSAHILYLSARGRQYWWDWGTQLTGSYYYQVNRNLKIGATLYTYFIGTEIDGAGLMGSIAIPFGNKVSK